MIPAIAYELQKHVAFRQELLAQYDDIDDETMADTLSGVTNLDDALIAALRAMRRDLYAIEAIERQMADLKDRANRLQARADKTKAMVLSAMERANMRKLAAPDFTASIKATPAAVIITDGALIPEDYLVYPDPRVDKITVKKALQEGFRVPGCELSNGGVTLSVRG